MFKSDSGMQGQKKQGFCFSVMWREQKKEVFDFGLISLKKTRFLISRRESPLATNHPLKQKPCFFAPRTRNRKYSS
jgi:hypothetical protein